MLYLTTIECLIQVQDSTDITTVYNGHSNMTGTIAKSTIASYYT
jgi:hypothetical protein